MNWAYGVTTVPIRRDDLLVRTLTSLRNAGFDRPRLFVDGPPGTHDDLSLPVAYRGEQVRTFGNFYLALLELLIREPTADRYAVFQDDLVIYNNARAYLEACPDPARGYWNLYTFPHNLRRCNGHEGWSHSDQMGKGAVALVFCREAVQTLLCQWHMVVKPQDPKRGWKNLDGCVVTAMKAAGFKEYIHNPSLVQHTGDASSIGNCRHQKADSFRGEEYDAREMIPKT
jgi:hypothetical protein